MPDNVQDTLPWTMSELEKFVFLGGGVSQTMSEIPYPRAESAPQALAYTHTPYHWLLAVAGLYFFPPKTDGRGYTGKPISARLIITHHVDVVLFLSARQLELERTDVQYGIYVSVERTEILHSLSVTHERKHGFPTTKIFTILVRKSFLLSIN